MSKKIFFTLVVICAILVSLSFLNKSKKSNFEQENSQINWISLQEALDLTSKPGNKKKIFIDCYTDWCGWCKKMDASTFQNPHIVEAINENYYAVKFDAEGLDTITYKGNKFLNSAPNTPKKGSRGNYHVFAAALLDGSLSYPSFVILDENQFRISKFGGFKNIREMRGILDFFGTNQYYEYRNQMIEEFQNNIKENKN